MSILPGLSCTVAMCLPIHVLDISYTHLDYGTLKYDSTQTQKQSQTQMLKTLLGEHAFTVTANYNFPLLTRNPV